MTAKDSAAMSALTEKLRAANEAAALRRDGEEKVRPTPGPWTELACQAGTWIKGPLDEHVALVTFPERSVGRSNAAFIVRACNAYQELVAALRWLTEATGCADPDCCKAAIDHAAAIHRGRTILAALDGSKP